MRERSSGNPEFQKPRVREAITWLTTKEAQLAKLAEDVTPGTQVEVFPAETYTDQRVAAAVFSLDFQLKGAHYDPDELEQAALTAIDNGFLMARITTEQLPGESEPNTRRFWQTLNALKNPTLPEGLE